MPIVILLSLHDIIIEGENLKIKKKKKVYTESLYWRYLYLNYKEMQYKNVLFCIENCIAD